jgi:hypothetical protein
MTELETKTEIGMSRRKFLGMLGTGIVGLALGGLSGGCAEKISEECPDRITLKVGEGYDYLVRYGGMTNKEIFSLAETGKTGVNLYYPIGTEKVCFRDIEFRIIEVTPEYITLDKIAKGCGR